MKIRLTNILSLLLLAGLFITQGAFAAKISLTSNAVKKNNQSTFGGYVGTPNSTLTGEVKFTLGGKDAQHFGIGQNNGQWFLRATHNFAQDGEYEITITADNGTEQATGSFTILVGSGSLVKKDARGARIYLPIVDGVVPVIGQDACGTFRIGDWELHHSVFGMSGHPSDKFEQFIYKDKNGTFGWAWDKGETGYDCPEGDCPAPDCYYQMSFAAVEYGINPWGWSTAQGNEALDLPIKLNDCESLIVSHKIDFVANDGLPGFHSYDNPSSAEHNAMTNDPVYARHALIYDLFLTNGKPEKGKMLAMLGNNRLTDEVIINVNYNAGYPDSETCNASRPRGIGDVMSESIEKKAVFSGGHWYDYHSWSPLDTPSYEIVCNYHQFRRVGGDVPGAPVPEELDLMPFFNYVKMKKADKDFMPDEKNRRHLEGDGLYFGRVIVGMNIYDHTNGSVTFRAPPTIRKVMRAEESAEVRIRVDASSEEGEIRHEVAGMLTDPPRIYGYMLNPDAAPYGRDNPIIEIDEMNPDRNGFNAGWHDTIRPVSFGLGWGGDTWYVFDPWPEEGVYDWDRLDEWIESLLKQEAKVGAKFSFTPRWLWRDDPKAEERSGAAGEFFPYLKRGHVLPPKDYEKWEELIYQTVRHLNVDQGYDLRFEAWNEPNVRFWQGTLDEYLEMNERTIRAIRRADPAAIVGGPSTAGFNNTWIRAVIEHCAKNKVPMDYISWHDYLWHAIQFGRVSNFAQQADMVKEFIAENPGIGDPELHVTEWAYMWKETDLPSPTFNAAFTIQSLFDMHENGISNGYYCGPLGSLDDPDPAVSALKMFNRLEPNRIATEVEGDTTSVGAIASRGEDGLSVLVWDFAFDAERVTRPQTPRGASREVFAEYKEKRFQALRDMVTEEMAQPSNQVIVTLANLPQGKYRYRQYAVDAAHHEKVMEQVLGGELKVNGETSITLELGAYSLIFLEVEEI